MKEIITLESEEYPKLLREINKQAPEKLYYKGNFNNKIFENCLAVVGSRRITSYGKRIVEQIVQEIAMSGITIVSGFMYGVDAAAHQAAIKVNGKTIAVMPCGIDLIHPEFQKKLYFDILDNNGLIVSEYENDFAPALWTYPKRNRIVAGLSKAVLVVEAALKSGSLITADFAKKFNRKIFVVPGPIFNQNSKGILQLIKQGAEPIDSAKDILKYYSKPEKSFDFFSSSNENSCCETEKRIINELEKESMSIDDLVNALNVPASKLGSIISIMEIKGIIENQSGRYYVN